MKMTWAALAIVAILVAPAGAAQMTEFGFSGTSHLRVAYGDVPLSPATESAGQWHAVEYRRITVPAGGSVAQLFAVSPGFAFENAACTCGNVTWQAGQVTSPSSVPAGSYVIAITTGISAGPADPVVVRLQTPGSDTASATIYLRQGQMVAGAQAETQVLPGADHPEYTIHAFEGIPHATSFVLNAPGSPVAASGASGTNPWLYAAAGVIVGAVVWAFLVKRGAVQRKSRKQVATTAAHVEAAQAEPVTVLEGRKRALMAALKELELARQANEMDVPTYDTLKAELKKETVTVMRAIDESGAKKA
ncbi:MAG: hypothetical protein V4510_10830 [bacterium]